MKKSILYSIAGVVITAIAVSLVLTPNKIVGGGLTGISTILYHTLSVPLGITFGIFNAVFLLIGLVLLGKEFVLKTIFGAALCSVLVEVFSALPPLVNDPIIAVVVGGVLNGVGVGLALANGFSTGGTDITGRILQHFFPDMKIGNLLLFINVCIMLASLIVFKSMELTVLSTVMMVISSSFVDWVIRQFNLSKVVLVVTDKGEEISKSVVSTSPRGVTMIDSTGAYTGHENKTLLCVLKNSEIESFRNKILALDPTAFIIFMESQGIIGNGFRFYK